MMHEEWSDLMRGISIVAIYLAIMLISCDSPTQTKDQRNMLSTADGVELTFDLPDLKKGEPEIVSQLNGYQLTASPMTEDCGSAHTERVLLKGPFISTVLAANCSYLLNVEVGIWDGSSEKLSQVFFSNSEGAAGTLVTLDETTAKDPAIVRLKRRWSDLDAKSASPIEAPDDESVLEGAKPGPAESTGPTAPTKPEQTIPSKPLAALKANQNLDLIADDGSTIPLTTLFKADHLVIDISSASCGYCIAMSDKHQVDTAFQATMNGDRCDYLTILPSAELASWKRRFPAGSFVGDHTFGSKTRSGDITQAFGFRLTGTPTVFIIDRQGGLVAQMGGGVPRDVAKLCGGK